MKVVENENAKTIIELLIPHEVLKLKPVIAGGFIVSLYKLAIRHSNPLFDYDLAIKIDRLKPGALWGELNLENLGLKKHFGDVDLWFLSDNNIWVNPKTKFLISDLVADKVQPRSSGSIFSGIVHNNRRSFYGASRVYKEELTKFGLDSNIDNSTYWANSFNTNIKGTATLPIQFIKNKYADIDELFSKFDLVNCCAAYHDGKFYFHDDFEDAHDRHVLEAGKTFKRQTELSKIWVSMRAFKYSKRFHWEFSKEICDIVTEVMIDAESIIKKIDDGEYDTKSNTIDLSSIDTLENPYGKNGIVPVDKMQGMIEKLLGNFDGLIRMSTFDEDNILLFVNSNNLNIRNAVKAYIDKKTEEHSKNRGIQVPKKTEPKMVNTTESPLDDLL